jgi:hypothetical protein
MDLLIGQVVTAVSDAEVFDGQGRIVGAVSAGTQLRISGARKFIIAQERGSQWFWAYPVAAEGQPSIVGWVREADLRPAFGVPYVGALSDVTLPGIVFPPYGVYQAFRGHEPGRGASEPPPGSEPVVPWSGVAKLAIIAGGALAVYLIYVASKTAASTQERVGYATGRYLGARYGHGASELPARAARATILPPEPRALPRAAVSTESTSHPLLGAYESYAP